MRLLIQTVNPWAASLDREPSALKAPAVLLRTSSNEIAASVWSQRCPGIKIVQIPGDHHTLWDAKSAGSLREIFITEARQWH